PIATVESIRRTFARALGAVCGSLNAALAAASQGEAIRSRKDAGTVAEAADALHQAQEFMSGMNGPPESEDEQRRLTSTLHALDHASRLAETAGGEAGIGGGKKEPDHLRGAAPCEEGQTGGAP